MSTEGVTIYGVNPNEERVLVESTWNGFLASLQAWERHRLCKDEAELIAHDAFVAGEVTLEEIRLTLTMQDG